MGRGMKQWGAVQSSDLSVDERVRGKRHHCGYCKKDYKGSTADLAVPVLFCCGHVGAVNATPGVLSGTVSVTHVSSVCPRKLGNCKRTKTVVVKRSSLTMQQQQSFDLNLQERNANTRATILGHNGWVLHPDFE